MYIGLIYGPMFSGKTKALIHHIANCGDPERLIFKHSLDSRTLASLSSHDPLCNNIIKAIPINSLYQIEEYLTRKTQYVFVDEAQFFDVETTAKALRLLEMKHPELHVVFAGLNVTWQGKSFPTITHILSKATAKHFCQGDCAKCGAPSTHSYLINHDGKRSLEIVGGSEAYESRCFPCFGEGMKPKDKTVNPSQKARKKPSK